MAFARCRFQHRRDQLRIGWQGKEILRAVPYRANGSVRVVFQAAGDHRQGDPFADQSLDQGGDRQAKLAQDQVATSIATQPGEACGNVVGLIELGSARGCDLCRLAELAAHGADDQDAHGQKPRSDLMISVMVIPSRLSSTITTSPRAIRRLLT